MRIVLVEDNIGLSKGICYRMQDIGHSVDTLHDGIEADSFLRSGGGDLVILDINLPGLDGLELLRNMRDRGDDRPVILLTARTDTAERVRGLDAGADDYLVKPFEMSELEARIRALARRGRREIRNTLVLGPLTLDLGARAVDVDGQPLNLPRREVAVLESLLAAAGRTVTRNSLIDHTYGIGADVEESAIEAHISRLRKRLRDHDIHIRVRRGIGYSIEHGTG